MPEDRTPDADELASTLPKNGPDDKAPDAATGLAPVPRTQETLHDDDPAHAASNADDGTEAS